MCYNIEVHNTICNISHNPHEVELFNCSLYAALPQTHLCPTHVASWLDPQSNYVQGHADERPDNRSQVQGTAISGFHKYIA